MFTQEVKEFPGTDVLADIIVDNKGRKSAAVVYNISRGGIYFVTSSTLSEGDRCLVYLKKNRNLFQAKGTVKWGRQIDPKDNMFRYGLEFKEPLQDSYIDLFIRCCN
ncbi:MAG TPA: PilZ domain-containing protein [Spirochaetota bacterium]|nr:PilZ domain-containing protein [Spirochaetota bacterium]HPJ34353.1 PilZ domain-containing protein [Spirochaetota bacterium]